jgi:hypothetical protein
LGLSHSRFLIFLCAHGDLCGQKKIEREERWT